MSIIRAPRAAGDFTIIRNDVLRDDRLSYRARGVLAVILSRPDNWRTDAVGLQRDGTEGREAIRAAMRELQAAGYVHQVRLQDERGRWRTVAMVYDTPTVQETLDLATNDDGFPTPGIPASGEPAVGEPGAIRRLEKKTGEEEQTNPTTPAASSVGGKPPALALALIMEGRGSHLVDPAKVTGILKRLNALMPAATPEQMAAAYLGLRRKGVNSPNAERIGDAITNGNGRPAVSPNGAIEAQDGHFQAGGSW